MLKRTQINISESQQRLLRQDASRMDVAVSELVRRFIDEHYEAKRPTQERLAHIQAATGVWKDREDIGDSVEYIKALRTPLRVG